MSEENRAAVLMAPGDLRVLPRELRGPGPNEVVVRVHFAGICGTDLALFRGDYDVELPLVLGHEFCGTVEEVGAAVSGEWRDAFVTSEISLSCVARKVEPCAMCRRSLANHCLSRTALGIRGADGAFADRVVVPAGALHCLPDDLNPWAGTLVEPVAAALRTFELTGVDHGDTVVVLGVGRLGLLVTSVARSFGARVLCVSHSKASRDLAIRFGAQEAFDAADEAQQRVREANDGIGADVVVECTGQPDGLARALDFVRARGTVALKSTCGRPAEGLYATDIAVREITVQGSRCGPFPEAIERLAAGLVPVEEYVTGVYPLEEAATGLGAASRATKILLQMSPP